MWSPLQKLAMVSEADYKKQMNLTAETTYGFRPRREWLVVPLPVPAVLPFPPRGRAQCQTGRLRHVHCGAAAPCTRCGGEMARLSKPGSGMPLSSRELCSTLRPLNQANMNRNTALPVMQSEAAQKAKQSACSVIWRDPIRNICDRSQHWLPDCRAFVPDGIIGDDAASAQKRR